MGGDELTDAAVPLETLIWRLFNEEEEVRVQARSDFRKGCRCDAAYIAGVLAKFTVEDRREMADEHGMINVDCAFCAKSFPVPAEITAP